MGPALLFLLPGLLRRSLTLGLPPGLLLLGLERLLLFLREGAVHAPQVGLVVVREVPGDGAAVAALLRGRHVRADLLQEELHVVLLQEAAQAGRGDRLARAAEQAEGVPRVLVRVALLELRTEQGREVLHREAVGPAGHVLLRRF